MHADRRAERDSVRAELLEDAEVGAFAEQVEIEVGQDPSVAKGIIDLDRVIRERDAEAIVEFERFEGFEGFDHGFEDARPRALRHRKQIAGRHDAQID